MTSPLPGRTPGQTVGPFFHIGLPYPGGPDLVPDQAPDAVLLHGRVLDGAGEPVPDALLELWQAGPDGRIPQAPGSLRRDGTFTGFGRTPTDGEGRYAFRTVRPAAPFFSITVFARGLLDRLLTRAYLPDHADDPFLAGLDPERRGTLIAVEDDAGLRFDVRLQGADETVFLALRLAQPQD